VIRLYSARLLESNINIEEERQQLLESGYNWNSIKKYLNERYRVHSNKRNFICHCCNNPVIMVLSEDRTCHFRHEDEEDCAGSKNYGQYQRQKSADKENIPSHVVGKRIIRTYLEGQLTPYGVIVKDGFSYKKILKSVPDFILSFPNGQEWSIDYITGLKANDSYLNSINTRIDHYKGEGFIPYFFISKEWLKKEDAFLSLCKSELGMMRKTDFDEVWQAYFTKWRHDDDGHFITEFIGYPLEPFDVQSLMYLDVDARQALISRVIPFSSNGIDNWGYQVGETLNLSMEKMFTLNEDQNDFLFEHPNEEQIIIDVHSKFLAFVQKRKLEIQQEEKRIVALRKQEEQRRRHQDNDPSDYRGSMYLTEEEKQGSQNSNDVRSKEQLDRDLKLRMEKLELGLNPDRYYPPSEMQRVRRERNKIVAEQNKEDKAKQAMRDAVMNKRVSGENYFKSPGTDWRNSIIRHYNKVYRQEITVEQLCDLMLNEGIEVNQNKKLMQYPVTELLEFIGKMLKHDIDPR
jgi:hypothetical protein